MRSENFLLQQLLSTKANSYTARYTSRIPIDYVAFQLQYANDIPPP